MLDYYGSIIKSETEIDKELIQSFRNKAYESYLLNIIQNLKNENILLKDYSISGWRVFGKKSIHEIINKEINFQKQINEQKLKFVYCYLNLFIDIDICQLICDEINIKNK